MADETLICMVEIPMGSRNKYEYDPALKAIKFDRFVSAAVVYPTDYGFIPDTLGEDGDELDVLVCVSEPTLPGCARTSIPSVTQSPLAGPTARRRCARSTRPASVTASGGTS